LFSDPLISNSNSSNNNNQNTQNNTQNNNKFTGALTMTELAKHNSATDCWQLINGQVYNLTPYIASGTHPGGDKIPNGCGQDATAMFEAIGKHNGRALAMLPDYLLGPIQK
jgi:cytochrome b involved in lipid metabolism